MSKKLFSDHEPDPLIRELDGNILWEYRPMDPNDTRGPYSSLAPFKAAERLRAMTWRPIETAPKDGTHFLSTSQHLEGEIFICTWKDKTLIHGNGKEHHVGWWLVGIPKRYYAGWGPLYMPIKMDDLMPTHWMPLPEPPDVSRETQDKT